MDSCTRRSPQSSDSRIRNSGGRIEEEDKGRHVFHGAGRVRPRRGGRRRRRHEQWTRRVGKQQETFNTEMQRELSLATWAVVPTVTWTLKNIPLRCNIEHVIEEFAEAGFASLYNYLYLPTDFNSKRNKGHAFVNLARSTAGEKSLPRHFGEKRTPCRCRKALAAREARDESLCSAVCLCKWDLADAESDIFGTRSGEIRVFVTH